jgi:potassium-transporting ATPase KdpC subunit
MPESIKSAGSLAIRSLIVLVLGTALFGGLYPLVMTGFAHAAFSSKANGSLIYRDGHVVGSSLVAQNFTSLAYFHERPSATTPAYNAMSTTFSNLGPTSPALQTFVAAQIKAVLKLEGPYNPGLKVSDIPVDAVTTSGSGIDPDISVAYADLQAHRVADVRHLSLATVDALVAKYTTGRSWGLFGEPGVNVLELNLALDNQGAQ